MFPGVGAGRARGGGRASISVVCGCLHSPARAALPGTITPRFARGLAGFAAGLPGAFSDEKALFEKAVILKMLGDARVEFSSVTNRIENLEEAVSAYDGALQIMSPETHSQERGVTLLDTGRVLLDIYDSEKSPAHLRKAVRSLREAVDLVRSRGDRTKKGLTMALMADALIRYAEVKDWRENLDRAARLYEAALGFLKEPEHAARRDRIREGLKEAVEKINAAYQ